MASAKITTTERNGKVALWVLMADGEVRDKHLWNIWDVSNNPTMEELLKAVANAYELGWQHKTDSVHNYINQPVNMEIDARSHE